MKISADGQKAAFMVGFGMLAILVGVVASFVELKWFVAGIFGAAAVAAVFYDYRFGVVCLTFLLPWAYSPYLPQTSGFNLINFIAIASFVSLMIQRIFGAKKLVVWPKVFLWCYLLPVAVAGAVALPYIHIGEATFPPQFAGDVSIFAPDIFWRVHIAKPLTFVLFAFLLANGIRDSRRPHYFLIPYMVSAAGVAVAVIVSAALGANDVANRAAFLENLGMHSNEYGMQLSLASGPLLFIATGKGRLFAKNAARLAFLLVTIGLVLTGSRGAATAYLTMIVFWLVQRRKLSDLFICIALVAILAAAIPDRVWDRLTLGLNGDAPAAEADDDPLTKGRLNSWEILAPDILESPIWGRGIGSTAWNAATVSGRYGAGHPHNMYIEILLDIGVLGFCAIATLYYRYARGFLDLSREENVRPVLQDFFRGALASFIGMLVMDMTNGHWMPHPEQVFLWFALGFAFAFWHEVGKARAPVVASYPNKFKKMLEGR